MKLTCLGSSSAGNCFVLEFDMGEGVPPLSLMVECGFPYMTLVRKATQAKVMISSLCGCLLTHCHNDHAIAAKDLQRRGVQIFATQNTLEAVGLIGNGWPMHYGKATQIAKGLKAMPFKVKHDAPDPAGFIIKTKKETVIFALDAAEWLSDLSAIKPDYIIIEANYDPQLMEAEQFSLRRRAGLKDMQRFRLNERIKASHMSMSKTLVTASGMDKTRLKAVFLAHLSDRMSSPSLWKTQMTALTGVPCYVCRKDMGIE